MLKNLKRIFISVLIVSMTICMMPSTAFAAGNDEADDIKYTVDSDEVLNFKKDDFNKECKDLTGEDLDYVKFDLPDDDDGILYYDYDSDEDEDDLTKVSSSKKYYYDKSLYISKITFIPDEDYSGTLTIDYSGRDVDGNTYTGEVKIKVEEADSSDTITYKIDEDDEYIKFKDDDFFDVCKKIQKEKLNYVTFTLPNSNDGTLYYDYDEDDDSNTKVKSSKKYYYEDDTPALSKVAFVPDEDFSGTVTIKYKGYDVEDNYFSGTVKIKVEGGGGSDSGTSDDTITYKINATDDIVNFNKKDFLNVCDELNNEELDYVKFTIPSATKGILYYDYSNGIYASVVASSKKYYYDSSPYISRISFVPNKSFTGTCMIEFTGYDVDGDSFSGKVIVTTGSSNTSASSITYDSKANAAVTFKDEDFNSVCKNLMSNQLNYVEFTPPSATNGTLYYGYTSNGNYTSKVKDSTKYYYGGSPYILNVTFVPANNVTGTVTVAYTGYDSTGSSYNGKVLINITSNGSSGVTPDTGTLVSSKYFKDVDISYSWAVPFIDSLYEAEIISGSDSGGSKLYSPASYVTRGDFIYLLYKALNFKTTTTTTAFSDVPSNAYYYNAITMAKALGIVQGSDNKFNPNSPITREDAMVMVLRTVNITGKTIASGDTNSLSKYNDGNTISDYSKSAVAALIKAGIITGSDDNKIYPQGNLTRAQIAAIIYRVRNL